MSTDDELIRRLRGLAEAAVNASGSRATFVSDMYFEAADRLAALIAERDSLMGSLEPSASTKQAYSGEFVFTRTERDEDGNEHMLRETVPWTCIKQIMAAIRSRAVQSKDSAS